MICYLSFSARTKPTGTRVKKQFKELIFEFIRHKIPHIWKRELHQYKKHPGSPLSGYETTGRKEESKEGIQ